MCLLVCVFEHKRRLRTQSISVLFFKSESTARLESVIFKWVSWFHSTPLSVFWGFTNRSLITFLVHLFRDMSCVCHIIKGIMDNLFKPQFVSQHYRRPGLNITALLSPRTWYSVLFAKLGVDVKGRLEAYLVDWHVSTCQIFLNFFSPILLKNNKAHTGTRRCCPIVRVYIFNLGVAWHLDHMCIFGTCLLEIWLLLCIREQCGWI